MAATPNEARTPWAGHRARLALLVSAPGGAVAHALPGSILSLWRDAGRLNLSVSLPLEDLVIASAGLEDLATLAPGQELSPDQTLRLSTYFARHLGLRHEAHALALTVVGARLQPAENSHVGRYTLLVVDFSTALPRGAGVFPLALRYDAVMHEVRNHRATVYWGEPGGAAVGLADFGFRQVNDATPTVLLTAP